MGFPFLSSSSPPPAAPGGEELVSAGAAEHSHEGLELWHLGPEFHIAALLCGLRHVALLLCVSISSLCSLLLSLSLSLSPSVYLSLSLSQ